VPTFQDVFSQFGATLPTPTLVVIAISNFFVHYWYILFGTLFIGGYFILQSWKRSDKVKEFVDRMMLRLPVFGDLVLKGTLARWTRTLATMFGAGVPLVEALDSVGGASGNIVYQRATEKIQQDVSTGTSLTVSMQSTGVFPPLVLQMASIGEESGSLDQMLGKAADIYEEEVDELVKALSSLLEPIIIVVLGVLIGGLVIAMYLPIFNLGKVVG
jgi:type IV pilus assembly protein PilC